MPLQPFSTTPPSEELARVGLGCLALSELYADKSPADRKRYYMTMDTPEDINTKLQGLPDISFPPMAVVHLYKQLNVPPHEAMYILNITDLYEDTLVFNLGDRLPLTADWNEVFADGNYIREGTYLVMVQGGKSHFFLCGGPKGDENITELFRDWGKVGGISIGQLTEMYDEAKVDVNEDSESTAHEIRQKKYLNWMIANALIANLAFTAVAIHG